MSDQPATSGKAIVSLLLALLSFGVGLAAGCPALLVGAVSLVLAVLAMLDIHRSRG